MKKHFLFSSEGSSPFLPPIFVVGFYTWGISRSHFIRGGLTVFFGGVHRAYKLFIHNKHIIYTKIVSTAKMQSYIN